MRRVVLAAVFGATLGSGVTWGTSALAALPMKTVKSMVMLAPFAGTGHAGIGGDVDGLKARGQALERARKAALEAAIDQVGGVEPAARKQVLAAPNVWTRSYRVLRQDDDGATATAVVSVEIDTAKLGKALAGPGAGTGSATSSGGSGVMVLPGLELRSEGCPRGLEADMKRALIGAGVVRDVAPGSAGPVLAASLQCTALGTVSYPRQTVVRAELALRPTGTVGRPATTIAATGFGEDAQAAASDALGGPGGLQGQVAKTMSARPDAGVQLKISAPWPAARVRRLERALRDSVVGVQAVTVAGVGSDGAVTLRIDGALTAAELHTRLATVQVPGVALVVGEVESNVVHVSLQNASPTPAPAP